MSYLWRAVRAHFLWAKLLKYQRVKKEAVEGLAKRRTSRIQITKIEGGLRKLYLLMQTEGTADNFAWIACKGFLGGVVLSWIVFLFCIIAFRMSLDRSTWLSLFLIIFLSFGLAFSSIIRCYVLMLLPQLFSKRGRQALTAYAFILAFGGPARNSIHNLGVLTSSLACGQEQLKKSMRQLVDLVKEPLHAMKTTLKELIKNIEKATLPLRNVVNRTVRVFTSVLSVINGVFSWLGNIVSVCNKETGTPYQRCIRSLNDAIEDCKVKMGLMKFMCSVVSVVKGFCMSVKVVDTLCGFMDMISNALLVTARRRLAAFRQHVADMLYVSIDIEHSVAINTTASKSIEDVVSSIVADVQSRTENLKSLLNFSVILPGFAFILLIVKVLLYRHRFLTSDRFDNRYITRKIAELDLTRIRLNLTTVLPLEFRERNFYTTYTSLTLLKSEKRRLIGAFFFLLITSVQIGCYILCDFGIYWTLMLIRQQGLDSAVSAEFPTTGVEIEGNGALADLYQEIGKAFQPPSPKMDLDPVPCLPEPIPPDKARVVQIAVLLLISWLLAITEPYGLRLRNVVMSYYYPARALQRTIWLHNHILLARGSFALFTRDLVRMQFGTSKLTAWQRIIHRYDILQKFFGAAVKACDGCAIMENEVTVLQPCTGPECSAHYCQTCESRLRNCILCYEVMNRFSLDIDEARDSSDDSLNMIDGCCTETEDSSQWADESNSSSDI